MIVQIVIWGTGIVAERICNYPLKEGVNIEAVVDNNSDKWGEKFLNYTILAPTELQNLSYDKIVILSSKYASEIYSQLIEMGIDESKIVKSEMYVFATDTEGTEYKKKIGSIDNILSGLRD